MFTQGATWKKLLQRAIKLLLQRYLFSELRLSRGSTHIPVLIHYSVMVGIGPYLSSPQIHSQGIITLFIDNNVRRY